MTIQNKPPLGIYPPNITNDWPPSIATDDSITVVVNNYYDKQIIKINLGANIQTVYALNIGWGEEFNSSQELVNPGINTSFYLSNATNNIDFNTFYSIYNIENYTSFTKNNPLYTVNFLRLLVNNSLSFSADNYLEIEVNQQYKLLNPVNVFINQSFDWNINNNIIENNNVIVPQENIIEWRAQQPTVNYIYNFNTPQNIFVNPSPNIPIVIYIENNGNWSQALLDDERYEYTIRFSVFYYQKNHWRDNVNNLIINDDLFNLPINVTPGNIPEDSIVTPGNIPQDSIVTTVISTSSGGSFPPISQRNDNNGVIRTMTTINNSSTHPSPINYFTANLNLNGAYYIFNIQTILYDNIDNLYVDPVIPENNTNNTDYVNTDPYQLTLTTCCPPKVHHGNGLRRSWTAGTFLIDGSHLNKARLCASRINNTIYGPIHGKPVFVKNNLNVYGRYTGFPGGSGAPIRNKF